MPNSRTICLRLLLVAGIFGWFAPHIDAAEMQYPIDIAVDAQGTIFVADRNLPGIWQIKDGKREIFFEGSKKFRTPLNAVRCLIIDSKGQLLAGDSSTREVYRFDADKKPVPLTKGGVGIPMALAMNKAGDLFIADIETQRIFKQPAAGGELVEFAQVTAPRGLIFDAEDRLLVVSGRGKNPILRFTPDGKSETITSGEPLVFPHHIVLDKDQNVYIADGYAKTIWKIGADKKPVKLVGGEPLSNPVGLAWQGDKLLVADPRSKDFLYSVEAEKLVPVPGAK
jgi:sugar lactone lactonase YvrE